VRPDVRAFDHSTSLLPVLKSFQENEFKLAIVTEVPVAAEDEDHFRFDPKPRIIGVVSQEDIIENILQGEI
jgi:CBS domain containing-hemolysin-like protein